jgi:hypothetical protein
VIVEIIYCYSSQYKGVIESRCGLLYLPLSPVYGLGGVAVSVMLMPLVSNPFVLFFLAMAACTVLEYVASFAMETVRHGVLGLQQQAAQPPGTHLSAVLHVMGAARSAAHLRCGPQHRAHGHELAAARRVLRARRAAPPDHRVRVLTLLAFRRFDQKVAYLKAQRDGQPLPRIDTAVGRMIDQLVPDPVMINTFPRMSHIVEYQELTGKHRRLIVADLHLGTPTERHRKHAEALARAQATEGVAQG